MLSALLSLALLGSAHATGRTSFTLPTSGGDIAVDQVAGDETQPRPAVIVLSGSKGFGAPAYDEIGKAFDAAGLDAFLVHVLTRADLVAIANAGNAQARIRYYAARLPNWVASVHDVVAHLGAQAHHASRVGVLGISLGAQIAAAAAVDRTDIGALVLVDGGFPQGDAPALRSLPPLRLIWGGRDRVFPVSTARKLLDVALRLRGAASLDVYDGAPHDFFLEPGTQQAAAARRSAADFMMARLK